MNKKAIVWSAVVGLCIAGVAAHVARNRPMPFDRAAWDADQNHDGTRVRMAKHLLNAKVLLGKTEVDVRELLGRPTIVDDWREPPVLHYSVGNSSSLGPAFLSLALELNAPSGTVVKCELRNRNI